MRFTTAGHRGRGRTEITGPLLFPGHRSGFNRSMVSHAARSRSPAWRRLLAIALFGCWLTLPSVHAAGPLSTAAAIDALSEAELAERRPARLRAVVTHVDPEWHLLFVQDETGGIYISGDAASAGLTPGDEVRLDGVAVAGGYRPVLELSSVTKLGKQPLPAPLATTLQELWTGRRDSDRVTVRGQVIRVTPEGGRWTLELAAEGRRLLAFLSGIAPGNPGALLHSEVELTGIAGSQNDGQRRLTGVTLFVAPGELPRPAASASEVIARAPLLAIPEIHRRIAGDLPLVVKVRGTVTYRSDLRICLQDGEHGLFVEGDGITNVILGQLAEVTGVPRREAGPVHLNSLTAAAAGNGGIITPLMLDGSLAGARKAEGRLVRFEGDFLHEIQGQNGPRLVIAGTEGTLEAEFGLQDAPPGLAGLKLGTHVAVTGVMSLRNDPSSPRPNLRILTRGPADFTVTGAPPWPLRRTLGVVSGLSLTLLVGLIALARSYRALNAARAELERRVQERTEELEAANRKLLREAEQNRQSLDSLRQSEARFAATFRAGLIGMCITRRADGRILDVNDSFVAMFGYPREELIGRTSVELGLWTHAGDRDRMLKRLENDGSVHNVDLSYRRRDGTLGIARYSLAPVELDGEQCLLTLGDDITEWRADLERLQLSKKHLRAIFEATPDCVHVLNREGRLLEMNPAGLRMLELDQLTPAMLRDPLQFVAAECREEYVRFNHAVCDGAAGQVEFDACTGAGRRRRFHSHGAPLPAPEGGFLNLSVTRDITEMRAAEHALRASQARFEAYMNHSPAIAFMKSPDDRLLWVNAAFIREIWGGEAPEWLGQTGDRLWPEATQRAIRANDLHVIRTGQPLTVEETFALPDRPPQHWLSFKFLLTDAHGERFLAGTAVNITDRRNAEAALHRAEERWQFALTGAGDGLWDFDVPNATVYYSPEWKSMLGFAPEEIGGSFAEWERLVHPDDLPEAVADFQRHLAGESPTYARELRMRTKAGAFKWVLTRGKVVSRDAEGRPLRVIGTHTDIDARVRGVQSLRESEARARIVNRIAAVALAGEPLTALLRQTASALHAEFPGVTVLCGRLDRRGRLSELETAPAGNLALAAAAEVWETAREYRDNLSAARVLNHPDLSQAASVSPWLATAGQPAAGASLDVALQHSDRLIGVLLFHTPAAREWSTHEVRTLTEVGRYLAVALHDEEGARERRLAEARVRASETKLAAIINSATDAIITLGPDHRISLFNPAAETTFGCRANEALGKPLDRFLPERFRAGHAQHLARFAASKVGKRAMGRPGELVGLRTDGTEFPIEASIAQAEIDGERLLTVILRDVTERQREEVRRTQLEAQLHQSQKMEAVGTLAGGIAHDFNNILGAIIGFLSLVRMDVSGQPEVEENLDHIRQAADRARDLVRRILTFSRQGAHDRRVIAVKPVVEESFKLLRAALPATVELKLAADGDGPTILADPTQLHQVVMNLVVNAADAIKPRAGCITIGYGPVELDVMEAAAHAGARPGRYGRLTVADTGAGMDANTVARIFEPFFTTKEPGQGTGLGLAMVHGLVAQHDGFIRVESAPGAGTTFALHFPAHGAEAEAAPASPAGAGAGEGRGRHILLVDDEASLARAGRMLLERIGYRVSAFTSPVEALNAFQAAPGSFDAGYFDLTMPGMTGHQLAAGCWEVRPGFPVLLATGYNASLNEERALALGFRELLLKPVTAEVLATALSRTLADRTAPDKTSA